MDARYGRTPNDAQELEVPDVWLYGKHGTLDLVWGSQVYWRVEARRINRRGRAEKLGLGERRRQVPS